MNPVARNISIAIIFLLVITIGAVSYREYKPKPVPAKQTLKSLTGTSSPESVLDLRSYAAGKANLEQIIAAERKSNASSSLASRHTLPQIYKPANLVLVNSSTPAFLKAYGLKLAQTLKTYGANMDQDIILMLEALENKDMIKTRQLLARLKSNQETVASLLKIETPKSASAVHLNLINTLAKNNALLADMSRVLDNPTAALESADDYRFAKIDFLKAAEKINVFFRENEIVFSPNEGSQIYLDI